VLASVASVPVARLASISHHLLPLGSHAAFQAIWKGWRNSTW
jgi:hypothetical protein